MGDLSRCSTKTMMPTTHHHPLMKLSIKLMRVLIIVHSSLSTWCRIHYTGLSPSWSYRIFQILSEMSFCLESDIYAVLKHLFPPHIHTLYFHSFAWHSSVFALHGTWICAMSPITEHTSSRHLPLYVRVLLASVFRKGRLKERGQHWFTYPRATQTH